MTRAVWRTGADRRSQSLEIPVSAPAPPEAARLLARGIRAPEGPESQNPSFWQAFNAPGPYPAIFNAPGQCPAVFNAPGPRRAERAAGQVQERDNKPLRGFLPATVSRRT